MRYLLLSVTTMAMLSATVAAQDSPLNNFTKDVDILVRLKSFDKTVEKVVGLVEQIQPGAGQFVEQMAPQAGMAIANPTLTGVDQTRDWYVGIYSNDENPPIVVFLIPSTETADLVDALGEGFTTKVKGDWVLYTEKQYEIPTGERSDSVVGEMGEAAGVTFARGDLSAFVNADHLVKVYADQLETGEEQVLEQLNDLRFMLPADSGIEMGPIVDMYGTLAELFFQSVKDAQSLTIAVTFEAEDGITIEEYVAYDPKTKTGEYFTGADANELPLLSKLPAGAVSYYGISGGVEEFAKWGFKFSGSMLKDKDAKQKMEDAIQKFGDVDFGSMATSIDIGAVKSGFMRMVSIAEATPTDKVREVIREVTKASSNVEVSGMKQTATIEEDAESYGDYKADVVKLVQEFDEALDPTGMQKKMQEMMFGEGGLESRVLYMDDAYVTALGGGQPVVEKFVAQMAAGKSNGLDNIRKPLLPKANFVSLLDLGSLVGKAAVAASEVEGFPLPIDEQMINSLNLMPSYIGMSVVAEPSAVRVRTNVPLVQMQSIGKIAAMFAALQSQL